MQEPPHPHQLDPGILHPWVKFGCRLAAERGHHAITVFLHDALNDIPIADLVSYNGMQILTSTVKNNWPDVVDAVLSKYRRDEGDNLFTNNQLLRSHCKLELITASKLGYTHIMEQVLRCRVPANEPIVLRGATLWPLHEATLHSHIGAMRLLLDWGADPNASEFLRRDGAASCHMERAAFCPRNPDDCAAGGCTHACTARGGCSSCGWEGSVAVSPCARYAVGRP
ncbi:hypothetical protein BJX66DRAFT_67985 [Aspergillus keveii]|uniref:Ankyrin repeat-containing domain protein n=1 Tax=Aspergillus keveii TaxID=714993 RepID=A0ABR4FPE3_9EURO